MKSWPVRFYRTRAVGGVAAAVQQGNDFFPPDNPNTAARWERRGIENAGASADGWRSGGHCIGHSAGPAGDERDDYLEELQLIHRAQRRPFFDRTIRFSGRPIRGDHANQEPRRLVSPWRYGGG